MEAWLSLVGDYGFPIAVTFYLLHRVEKKLDQLNQSVMYLGKLVQMGNEETNALKRQVAIKPVGK
ncbi:MULTISPECIES: YvrJ family protein [Bacillaceae]|uniref:YvrJ family protein n=1 Tax=Evansella alkalicola TaxID=745819 RepID=A0ABS6JXE6_9BACI|nr:MULTISPECIES: YvrJ family protein [Bacillaceae]MBU9723253.1 YvrJ family protein [Bacillus alkalicola]